MSERFMKKLTMPVRVGVLWGCHETAVSWNAMDIRPVDAVKLGNRGTQSRVEALAKLGLEEHEVKGDGNCLFRAVAHQVKGDEEEHLCVRQECVDFMRGNRTKYEALYRGCGLSMCGDESSDFCRQDRHLVAFAKGKGLDLSSDENVYDVYCERMARGGCWGGIPELCALATKYKRVIYITQVNGEKVVIPREPVVPFAPGEVDPSLASIYLIHDENRKHYSSIKKVVKPKKQVSFAPGEVHLLGVTASPASPGHLRPGKRVSFAPGEVGLCVTASPASNSRFQWNWDGQWKDFDAQSDKEISGAFEGRRGANQGYQIRIGGQEYEIDFLAMTQTNRTTRKVREIRDNGFNDGLNEWDLEALRAVLLSGRRMRRVELYACLSRDRYENTLSEPYAALFSDSATCSLQNRFAFVPFPFETLLEEYPNYGSVEVDGGESGKVVVNLVEGTQCRENAEGTRKRVVRWRVAPEPEMSKGYCQV